MATTKVSGKASGKRTAKVAKRAANGKAAKVAAKGTAPSAANIAAITFKAVKGKTVAQLLALRASLPRQHLAQHYAIRRALRAQGYFISQQR